MLIATEIVVGLGKIRHDWWWVLATGNSGDIPHLKHEIRIIKLISCSIYPELLNKPDANAGTESMNE